METEVPTRELGRAENRRNRGNDAGGRGNDGAEAERAGGSIQSEGSAHDDGCIGDAEDAFRGKSGACHVLPDPPGIVARTAGPAYG